jgi:hypothetical protein
LERTLPSIFAVMTKQSSIAGCALRA